MAQTHGSIRSFPLQRPKYHRVLKWWTLACACFLALLLGLAASTLEGKSHKEIDVALVQSQVISFADSWDTSKDPLVEIDRGLMVKRSNVEGVIVEGIRYYYSMTNAPSFDPASLGKAKDYEIVSTIDQGTPWELVIYRLQN